MPRSEPIPGISIDRRTALRIGAGMACAAAASGATAETAGPGLDRIKALAFDVQGSTLDFYTPLADMGRHLNERKNLTLDWDRLIGQWRAGYRVVIDAILSGDRSWISTELVYRSALDGVLDRNGLGGSFTAAERDAMTDVWAQMVPWPDTMSGLSRLRRKYVLTTLSNAGMNTVVRMVKANALPFDCVLTGELSHSFKPDAGVYRLVPQNLGVPVASVMMVACHKYDLQGAKRFGFQTAYVSRPKELGPNGKADTVPEPYIDMMTEGFDDLADRLGA